MSWFKKLTTGLNKTSSQLTGGITRIFTHKKLELSTLDELEELLIAADLGPVMAAKMVAQLSRNRVGKEISEQEVCTILADYIAPILEPVVQPLAIDASKKPFVILMVGVNGAGKTTTIGKLAQQFSNQGKSVMLAAGDTFRAAAVEQLQIWGDRVGCPVVKQEQGWDSAALAFEALEKAQQAGCDVLLIDTAGRLQNNGDLMAEVQKMVRVLKKRDPSAPHATVLTLDATVGQNAISQVDAFNDMLKLTGLVITKLDGSAKAGVIVPIAERFKIPVHAIGVGEGINDLQAFDALSFSRALLGLPESDSMAA